MIACISNKIFLELSNCIANQISVFLTSVSIKVGSLIIPVLVAGEHQGNLVSLKRAVKCGISTAGQVRLHLKIHPGVTGFSSMKICYQHGHKGLIRFYLITLAQKW